MHRKYRPLSSLLHKRAVNGAGALCCAGMMGFALYAQHVLLLDPCPLCVLQRLAVILLGCVFLLAAVHNPQKGVRALLAKRALTPFCQDFGGRVYAGFIGLFAAFGAGVAAWQIRLQNLPPDEVPSCGPGFDYMVENFPLSEALGMIFKGSGECAEVSWRFLSLSMPTWVLISVVALGSAGIWNNLRR